MTGSPAPSSALAALVLSLAVCSAAHAYEYPSIEHGFKPQRAFQIGDVDHVRLFNGGLELTVPIGGRYPVGGEFSYGLTLSYSSQLWDYWSVETRPGNGNPVIYTQAWPVRHANAGLGWRLSLGEFSGPSATGPGSCRDCYIGPDGARHPFYQTLHADLPDDGPATMYTRDGTYLRRRTIAGGWEIDFPDGDVHRFDATGRLTQMRDRFGNSADVTYSGSWWRITDSHNRIQTVYLRPAPHYGQVVDRVELAAFGGTVATYWSATTTCRSRGPASTPIPRPPTRSSCHCSPRSSCRTDPRTRCRWRTISSPARRSPATASTSRSRWKGCSRR